MAQPVSQSQAHVSRATLIAAGVAIVLVALTGALWVHYGTAVFYEMIVAGIALCL
jgi:hypothetical protein